MDEQQAIQLLKKGDIGGLDFLVCAHQVKAVRVAYLITRDPGFAEDIVQDAFVHVFVAIRGFDETRSFEPWFLRSVVNASVKLLQKSARQVQVALVSALGSESVTVAPVMADGPRFVAVIV